MAQQRQQAQIGRAAKDQLRGELTDALVRSVHGVWFGELMYAISGVDVDAIDAQWAPEATRGRAGSTADGR